MPIKYFQAINVNKNCLPRRGMRTIMCEFEAQKKEGDGVCVRWA